MPGSRHIQEALPYIFICYGAYHEFNHNMMILHISIIWSTAIPARFFSQAMPSSMKKLILININHNRLVKSGEHCHLYLVLM